MTLPIRGLWTLALLALVGGSFSKAGEPTPREVFEKRLLPIFKSPQPTSCVQCHLAGVDLKDYILPDHEKTFRSLRDQGLIDLGSPEKSKILRLIQMGDKDKPLGGANDPGAALIRSKTRKSEYEAFAAWIKSCCSDPKLRKSPRLPEKELGKPSRPMEVIRHARKDRLLSSFGRGTSGRCASAAWAATPKARHNATSTSKSMASRLPGSRRPGRRRRWTTSSPVN